jgi:hypothetical protein
MSFIATGSTTATDTPSANTVTNDGFFPDIELGKLREAMRLDGTVTVERLRDAVINAIVGLNAELRTLKAMHVDAGVDILADAPGDTIGGEKVALSRYRTAVYRTARADLTERYRAFDATKSGLTEADKNDCSIDDDRREARWAVRDLLGRPRVTVELI